MWGEIFVQLERLLPERYRVRIVACLAFMGLIGWIYVSNHIYAKESDVAQFKQTVAIQIDSAVKPLSAQIKEDRTIADHRYLDDLSNQILDGAARCNDTKDDDAKQLYRNSLSHLLQQYQSVEGFPYPENVSCP